MYKKLGYSVLLTAALLGGCGTVERQSSAQTNQVAEANTSSVAHLSNKGVAPPDHIVIVVEENHSYQEIANNPKAPYMNSLMRKGASLAKYHGIEHPSQPNYLDLFSGSNQGVTSDACPHTLSAPNLASELIAAHLTFSGYSEDLPSVGYTGCTNGHAWFPTGATYARKHSPWVNFTNVPSALNLPFSSFPKDFGHLPTVSFVIPNLKHDMHSGSIESADGWLQSNLDPYVQWAKKHNSLLILTWDEDDKSQGNTIPTFFVGPMVQPGLYQARLNHFNLLRTVEDLYHLAPLGKSKNASPIMNIWKRGVLY